MTMADYGPPCYIQKNDRLPYVEQVIEEYFARYINNNLDKAIQEYKSMNGKVLNTDEARVLCSIWKMSHMSRAVCSVAVHNPASYLVKEMYRRDLEESRDNPGVVLFTAGGGGSGKSHALRIFSPPTADQQVPIQEIESTSVPLDTDTRYVKSLLQGLTRIIYDTTCSDFSSTDRKIQQALSFGNIVFIVYVYRPFEDAVKGVIERARNEDDETRGRIVPLSILVKDHANVPKVARQIIGKYANNEKVRVTVFNNSQTVLRLSAPLQPQIILNRQDVLNFLLSASSLEGRITYNENSETVLMRLAEGVLDNARQRGISHYIIEAMERNSE